MGESRLFFSALVFQGKSCYENTGFHLKVGTGGRLSISVPEVSRGMDFSKLLIKCQETLGL